MKLFYVATGQGCCIRAGKSANAVGKRVLREVGTYAGVKCVREATESDIAWVKGMGGHIPSGTLKNEV